jgi:transaldolase / glucose-6-phosphate isomerase
MATRTTTSERLAALASVGTSIWLDMIRRSMIEDGELDRLIGEDRVTGLTANPAIFEKAILGSPDYDEALAALAREGRDAQQIYETLAIEDVQGAADALRSVWDRTEGEDGYASIEVAPEIARDAEATIAAARDFWNRVDRPNVMIKIPGTDEGARAIRASIAAGININVTLLFSIDAYAKVADAYMSGLEDRLERGDTIDAIASVASFFVSRVDTLVDAKLAELGHEELAGTAGVANAKLAYDRYRELVGSERWARLEAKGAGRQRPLWASTGTKNPAYSDVKYVEELAGPETVNTMPIETLHAFADHGNAEDRLTGSADEARQRMRALEEAGVSIDEVTEQLLEEGIEKFVESMQNLLAGIERRRDAVLAGKPRGVEARLGEQDAEAIGERVKWAEAEKVVRRIWRKDHTLWGRSPDEISNRLGWLRVSEQMLEHFGELSGFATRARDDGLTDCVLLGMGGSSLAPEVLRRSFPDADGLRLHVLDSTHPATVARVTGELPLDTSLFVVASKSGTTLEPNCFYRYFRGLVKEATRFAAITDPGTSLDELGQAEGFRHVFRANPEIGGRYSALSHFGMVPGTVAAVDTREILERAEIAVQATIPTMRCERSWPLWLGLAIGELARRGRDKLTFVVDEPLGSFGLWAEQLVAESTGKQGTGIVPIAGEPLGDPSAYGDDRVFAHLRGTASPDAAAADRLEAIAAAGHPVIEIPFEDREDLGSQFFAWEFAVGVAGAVLGINPFDQPNVQQAKDLTNEVIGSYVRDGSFPAEEPDAADGPLSAYGSQASTVTDAIAALVRDAGPGRFFATLAYVPESDRADAALRDLRLAVRDARRCATTTGYGPRYLHSTGQLHKGGPRSGIFLQVTSDGREGLEVPDAGYDFAALVHAQAIGDLRALRDNGLPVLRVHVSGDPAEGLEALAEAVQAAVDKPV